MSTSRDPIACARGGELIALFHDPSAGFGDCQVVSAHDVPPGMRQLLAHSSHMTVAMERLHGEPVSLRVIAREDREDRRYAREILLCLGDGRVVQHGIARIDLSLLPPTTASAIRAESAPLGRVLLAAGLLCEVHAEQLLRIIVGPDLAGHFNAAVGTETYGRVATIGLDSRPVIELLEISAPVSGSDRASSG